MAQRLEAALEDFSPASGDIPTALVSSNVHYKEITVMTTINKTPTALYIDRISQFGFPANIKIIS
jgi:predicted ATPase